MYAQCILLLLPVILAVISGARGSPDDLTANCDATKSDCISSTKENVACANEETNLFRALFSSYGAAERATRGVEHYGDKLSSTFGVKFINVPDVDTTNGVVTINAWTIHTWTDSRLKWDPSDYGGLKSLQIPSDVIWMPDVMLYNRITANVESKEDVKVLVYSTGQILWMPLHTIKAPCDKDISAGGPAWNCDLKIGSWTYDGNQFDIDFYEGKKEIDLDHFMVMANGYTVTSLKAEKHSKHYPGVEEPYVDLTFSFKVAKE